MAHIRRHPKAADRWQVRYRDPSGRERSKNFSRKADAEKFLVTVEADKLRGEWVDPKLGRTTVSEWADRFMSTKAHLKPYTVQGYESLLRCHVLPAFGSVPLARLDPMAVTEWVTGLQASGLSASRVRQAHQVLSAMCKLAVRAGYIARNPAEGVDLPRLPQGEMPFLTAAEVTRLAEAIEEPYAPLVYVLAYGGLRWGEMAALRRGGCELLRSRLHVVESLSEPGGRFHFGPTKTHRRRTVVVPSSLRELLAAHLARHVEDDPEALVFTSPRGRPLRNSNFAKRFWHPAVGDAGLPEGLRIHDLRHTCAALLIAQGAHPKEVQTHLGHRSIQVTMDRYGHLYPDRMEALAERLDAAFRESQTDTSRTPRGEIAPLAGIIGAGAGDF